MSRLSGLVVAAATPLRARSLEVDHAALGRHCQRLLDLGADGINLLGTTGEATSLSVAQRTNAMAAVAEQAPDMGRYMVGTGAAAIADAISLTRSAVDFGYNGALILPPFYYKGLSEDDLVFYFDALVRGVDRPKLSIYLYHIPQNTGLPFSIPLIERLRRLFPGVFVGLKDSSGQIEGTRAFASELADFDVFAAAESALPDVKSGLFKGIISASLNVTIPFISKSFATGDAESLKAGADIRMALSSVPLVPAVRWALGDLTQEAGWATNLPPLSPIAGPQELKVRAALTATAFEDLRAPFRAIA